MTPQIVDISKLYHDDMVLEEKKGLKKFCPQVNLRVLYDKMKPLATPINVTTITPARNRARVCRMMTNKERHRYLHYLAHVMILLKKGLLN